MTGLEPETLAELESSVVGGMLRWPASIDEVLTVLRPEDFYSAALRTVVVAIAALHDAGKPADLVTLADRLRRDGDLENCGGPAYLATIWDATGTGAHTVYHARLVRDRSIHRQLAQAGREIVRDSESPAGSAEEALDAAEARIFGVSQAGVLGQAVPFQVAADEFADRLDVAIQNKGRAVTGLPTGFLDLDACLAGLHDGELTVIAARPSVGKTALCMAIIRHLGVRLRIPVFFASLEQARHELAGRLVGAEAGIDGQLLRTGRVDGGQQAVISQVLDRVRSAPVHVDDGGGQGMRRIAANARRLKSRHGIRLVLVDYLQLVEPENRREPRHEQVSGISRRMKHLARELKVPVVALAQLNRASEESPRPKLSHLRESGAIEADADTVLLMHRVEQFEPGQKPPDGTDLIEVQVAKQRNGPTRDVFLLFDKAKQRFENYAPQGGRGPVDEPTWQGE